MTKKPIKLTRPQTVDDILEVLRKGRLDRRTKQAKSVVETKKVLELAPHEAMKSMLRHQVALNTLIERELVHFVLEREGNLLDQDGRLPKGIGDDLLRMQRATISAMKQLSALEGHSAGVEEKDVSTLVLECQDATD